MLRVNPKKVIADYPAVAYMEARPMYRLEFEEELVALHHDDVFAVDLGRGFHEFTAFTITGYAVDNAMDPFEAHEEAKRNGHAVVTAYGNGASLTAWEREKKTVGVLTIGQRVLIEGKIYALQPAPNSNVTFVAA